MCVVQSQMLASSPYSVYNKLRWCWPLCLQVYYPVRHHLVQHMVSAMQRLGFTPSVTIEQRRLAVDLSEVVIKWELQRIKDQQVGLSASAVISHWLLTHLLGVRQ